MQLKSNNNILNINDILQARSSGEEELSVVNKIEILKISNNAILATEIKTVDELKNRVKEYYLWLEKLIKNQKDACLHQKLNIDIDSTFSDDHILCLEKGCIESQTALKTLAKHLRSKHNMSTEEYKEKWGLPHDYPLVCKNYSEIRRKIATK